MKYIKTFEQFVNNKSDNMSESLTGPTKFKGNKVNDLYKIIKGSTDVMVQTNKGKEYAVFDANELKRDLNSTTVFVADEDGEEIELKVSDISLITIDESYITEGKIADIESEIASINTKSDESGEMQEADYKRLKKLISRIDKYTTSALVSHEELGKIEAKIHELSEESKAATEKIKSNTESLKANHKGGGFSFAGLMDANKQSFARIESINTEIKDLNKQRDRLLTKIESI